MEAKSNKFELNRTWPRSIYLFAASNRVDSIFYYSLLISYLNYSFPILLIHISFNFCDQLYNYIYLPKRKLIFFSLLNFFQLSSHFCSLYQLNVSLLLLFLFSFNCFITNKLKSPDGDPQRKKGIPEIISKPTKIPQRLPVLLYMPIEEKLWLRKNSLRHKIFDF